LNSEFAGSTVDEDVLNRISIRSVSGNLISLSSVANFRVEPSISNINHEDKMKSIIVSGYLHDPDVRDTLSRISHKIEENPLPIGVDWEVGGSTAKMAASFQSLLFSMLIAVFLVYAVMVIQFERFIQPLIVMAAVPFTFIGVVAGLSIFGSTLSIVSFLGIIALAGIVVNNAIVMIDYTNLIRDRDGLDLFEAVVEGAASRLKPILMTTLTTVLGIIPMALGIGEGAEIYSPLGQSIAGGLLTSTLITLFLIPVLYYLVEIRRKRAHPRK
jgi:HAE1 family hydrophobic/amphiphilic exporter-1